MQFRMNLFSPAEAASMSGASTVLQREWRRREIIPQNEPGTYARFDTRDVARLLALKTFSSGEMSVASLGEAADEAAVRTMDMLVPLFRPSDWAEQRWPSGTPQDKRFVLIWGNQVMMAPHLDGLPGFLEQFGRATRSPAVVVYDCLVAAQRILDFAPRPVFVPEDRA